MTDPALGKLSLSPRIASVLVLAATFTLGAVLGMVLDRTVHHRWSDPREGWRGGGPPWAQHEAEHRRRWARVAQQLELTPAQAAAADSIFAQRSKQLEAARSQMEPAMKEIMKAARQQIDSLLTPAQRTKLQEMRRQRDQSRGQR